MIEDLAVVTPMKYIVGFCAAAYMPRSYPFKFPIAASAAS